MNRRGGVVGVADSRRPALRHRFIAARRTSMSYKHVVQALRIITRMQGLHLTADLRGCDATLAVMVEVEALRSCCLTAVAQAGLLAVAEVFHRFPAPGGVTGVVLLAESHMAVHTWPELGAVTVDVYVCNFDGDNSAKAGQLMATLEAAFAAVNSQRHRLLRGAAS
jgi:S-adenosylmethionine decarboxylase